MPILLSRCHDAICTEETGADGETLIYKCSICDKIMDKSAYMYQEDTGTGGDPFGDLPLKDENTTPSAITGGQDSSSEAPRSDVKVKDGYIYLSGKLEGRVLSDREWFQIKFGTETNLDKDTLKKIRQETK